MATTRNYGFAGKIKPINDATSITTINDTITHTFSLLDEGKKTVKFNATMTTLVDRVVLYNYPYIELSGVSNNRIYPDNVSNLFGPVYADAEPPTIFGAAPTNMVFRFSGEFETQSTVIYFTAKMPEQIENEYNDDPNDYVKIVPETAVCVNLYVQKI